MNVKLKWPITAFLIFILVSLKQNYGQLQCQMTSDFNFPWSFDV